MVEKGSIFLFCTDVCELQNLTKPGFFCLKDDRRLVGWERGEGGGRTWHSQLNLHKDFVRPPKRSHKAVLKIRRKVSRFGIVGGRLVIERVKPSSATHL